jgi:two-component system phosphate regulon sensor histidine kinase PhoR
MNSRSAQAEIDVLKGQVAELQRQLREKDQSLLTVEHRKNEYLQNVAHQLTAPINAIKMNIESLEDDTIPLRRKQVLLRSVYSQGTILVHLIKNFSLMSHLEADHQLEGFRERPDNVDLYRLCINLCNDFQPMGAPRRLTIASDEGSFERARNPTVYVIKNLAAQVIYNLLENAVKYADKGSDIALYVTAVPRFTRLSIESTGIPIAPDEKEKIFDRGVRGQHAEAMHPAGTGFGLFIAQRIMSIHKGRIEVEPNGRKTTFHVFFPSKPVTL